jgi:hypothetical protein
MIHLPPIFRWSFEIAVSLPGEARTDVHDLNLTNPVEAGMQAETMAREALAERQRSA